MLGTNARQAYNSPKTGVVHSLSGDFAFLDQATAGANGGGTVLEAMTGFATAYRNLTDNATAAAAGGGGGGGGGGGDGGGSGGGGVGDCLADYGLAANLLECVPTYQHKVSS
jgi:hypothetical protein